MGQPEQTRPESAGPDPIGGVNPALFLRDVRKTGSRRCDRVSARNCRLDCICDPRAQFSFSISWVFNAITYIQLKQSMQFIKKSLMRPEVSAGSFSDVLLLGDGPGDGSWRANGAVT
jgi:hypothetical protein